ncbi:spermidine synthase [Sanguibacter antarcticus]|uniref:Methyltransferase family protein n=1 Tax=Sanguibacter antarcticus TaxID=372484 RepID=A0A2A9E4B3_9MICO|nr:fused MFS/spermidine synthase [Sanguibacter antarcticus]PFG33476.1 methyltransferase family protein [Sanguibacter antarcticus]
MQTLLPEGIVETTSGTAELLVDRDNSRALTLHVNGVPSSYIDLDDPLNVGFEYMEIMCAILAAAPPGPLDAVHLGAAGCAMARFIDAARPGSRQIGVDIDARLLELARTWFDLPRSPRLRLRAGDARAELATLAAASTDVVVRDVFAGDQTPHHLVTGEFVDDVLRVLRPGGLYLVNCADRPPLSAARSEVATLRAALARGETDARERAAALGAVANGAWRGELAVVSEPGLLKGRRYGNLVLALRAPSAEPPEVSLGSAGIARSLRSLAVPAHILTTDAETAHFCGQARTERDDSPRDPQRGR